MSDKSNFFKRTSRFFRIRGKRIVDRLLNNQLKHSLLTAIPFWAGSFIVALLAVVYSWLFRLSELLMFEMVSYKKWLVFFILPAGFILSWWIVKRFSPYSKGSGIPQVMAAIEIAGPDAENKIPKLLSLRVIIVKIISSLVLVLGGGNVGREGPTIQMSGSVFQIINRLIPKWWPKVSQKNMILTGAAAGLSAAFNTPLGGIVFAVEELTKIHFNYFKTAVFTAVIIAGLTVQQFAGSYLYLGYPPVSQINLKEFFVVILIAAIAGLSAAIMSKIVLAFSRFRKKFTTNTQQLTFLFVTAMMVACFAYFVHESILSSGKDLMEHYLFTEDKHAGGVVPLSRMLGSIFSFTSGGAGGIFAPALSIGAAIGSSVSGWFQFPASETNVMILAGMVGFLTGITRSPFTSAILVLEMTDRHSIILHLMTAALVGSIFARIISSRSLYTNLKIACIRELEEESAASTPEAAEMKSPGPLKS